MFSHAAENRRQLDEVGKAIDKIVAEVEKNKQT